MYGTYIKAHKASDRTKKNVDNAQNWSIADSRGGQSTKIYAVVDGLGNPCVLMLTEGQVHDSVMIKSSLDQLDISKNGILTDKAYGFADNWKYFFDLAAEYCILPKRGYQSLGNVIISTKKSGTW